MFSLTLHRVDREQEGAEFRALDDLAQRLLEQRQVEPLLGAQLRGIELGQPLQHRRVVRVASLVRCKRIAKRRVSEE